MALPRSATRFDAHRYRITPLPGRIAVLASGGLDSGVLLAKLAAAQRRVFPIYVRAGLLWERQELAALRRFLNAIGPGSVQPLSILRLPIDDSAGDHWSVTGRGVPGYRAATASNYILGRNLTLIAAAAVLCARLRIGEIAMAALEANPFPDAQPRFFKALARAVELGTGLRLRIRTPYVGLSKAEVIRRGRRLPLGLTVSCIRPRGLTHCGRCTKCAERKKGFRAAAVADPTRYA